uniref:formin-like protein 20 n=1 Tax=Fragaria vesca subsp. vesca TaxID=101020 RepID=UPI0005C80C86|nr:PREDICTED: formin-like protein 20 [Fragaria vesca subsp. vesca]
MAATYDKYWPVALFVLSLLLGFASCYHPIRFGSLPKGPIPSSAPSNKSGGHVPPSSHKLNDVRLQKREQNPPSQHVHKSNSPPPPPHNSLNFGMLLKGIPVPPSAPGGYPPPPPPHNSLNIGILPKGVPVPPSAPGGYPPPTPPHNSLNFGVLPKGEPIPPSAPSSDPPPPPPPGFSRIARKSLKF